MLVISTNSYLRFGNNISDMNGYLTLSQTPIGTFKYFGSSYSPGADLVGVANSITYYYRNTELVIDIDEIFYNHPSSQIKMRLQINTNGLISVIYNTYENAEAIVQNLFIGYTGNDPSSSADDVPYTYDGIIYNGSAGHALKLKKTYVLWNMSGSTFHK